MISPCQQLLKQQLLQIQCQSVTDMWTAAVDGRTLWFPATCHNVIKELWLSPLPRLPSSPPPLPCGAGFPLSHLEPSGLADTGFISIKLGKKGEMCAEHRETVCHQYIRSEGCRKCLNNHSHPQPLHPSFTQLWALPAAFQAGLKLLAKG